MRSQSPAYTSRGRRKGRCNQKDFEWNMISFVLSYPLLWISRRFASRQCCVLVIYRSYETRPTKLSKQPKSKINLLLEVVRKIGTQENALPQKHSAPSGVSGYGIKSRNQVIELCDPTSQSAPGFKYDTIESKVEFADRTSYQHVQTSIQRNKKWELSQRKMCPPSEGPQIARPLSLKTVRRIRYHSIRLLRKFMAQGDWVNFDHTWKHFEWGSPNLLVDLIVTLYMVGGEIIFQLMRYCGRSSYGRVSSITERIRKR